MSSRVKYGNSRDILPIPSLISFQKESFKSALDVGIKTALNEASPMTDTRGALFELYLDDYFLSEPEHTIEECVLRDGTYNAKMNIAARLLNKATGEVTKEDVYVGEIPMMTPNGTFIINGNERVVISQIVRAQGVFFSTKRDASGILAQATIKPHHGKWLDVITKSRQGSKYVLVRVDKKKTFAISTFFRVLGFSVDRLKTVFDEIDPSGEMWETTNAKENATTVAAARLEFYKKIRNESPAAGAADKLVDEFFFDARRYSLSKIGRHMLNKRLGTNVANDKYTLDEEDLLAVAKRILEINVGDVSPEDMDHLGNRRVRGVGELLQERLRDGLEKTKKTVSQKMLLVVKEHPMPQDVMNMRSLQGAIRDLFISALAQTYDQDNILKEISHKRRITSLGPGGLNKKHADSSARDVHESHYGRLCPIESPEGPNIGLISQLALYAQIDEFGFIETPYRLVVKEKGKNKATDEIVYLTADGEHGHTIAQANTVLDKNEFIIEEKVEARRDGKPHMVPTSEVDLMDVSGKQIVSAASALIPFLEHDDGNRAMMGANMQGQAVPLLHAESPLIGTGLEEHVAANSGYLLTAQTDGTVEQADHEQISVKDTQGNVTNYPLMRYRRTNGGTTLTHRVKVIAGQTVKAGDILADASAMQDGELALGRNFLVAFMPFKGLNFEDAIAVSERLVENDYLTSIHLQKHECKAVMTKLGEEEITKDLPDIDRDLLVDLDERGIIRVGAKVKPGSILVGKTTPKSESDPTAEERLLRAIFGEKSREVRDTSYRLPHGEEGEVIDVKVFTSKNNLNPMAWAGVKKMVRITIASERKVSVGDKLAGRHGNKGVISKILPVADMPVMPDGTPVDMVLNPLGVPSRMNVGQVLETHMSWAAHELGIKIATPVFEGASEKDVMDLLKKAGLPENGKVVLRDGITGEAYDSPVTVGYMYMLKLHHLVADKIHARSTGPYALVTQQPLGGKAQFGGQRFGEMEVWALEGHGAAHTLQELTTIKSDDIVGRLDAYWAILNNQPVKTSSIPEGFKVLIKQLQALCLSVTALDADKKEVNFTEHAAPHADAQRLYKEAGATHRYGD